MDTSEEYIKMCRTATKLQELWKPEFGDWFSHVFDGNQKTEVVCQPGVIYFAQESTWLPRQDQLQDIVIHRFKVFEHSIYEMENAFSDFIRCPPLRHHKEHEEWLNKIGRFITLEQLWLAFVMNELHRSIWNGKEWVSA